MVCGMPRAGSRSAQFANLNVPRLRATPRAPRWQFGRAVCKRVLLSEGMVPGPLTLVSRSSLKTILYRYGIVVSSVAAALGVSVLLREYVYPRPMVLLALVLCIWGRGLGPSLVGAGLATVAVGLAFPELTPKYGAVSDAAMFGLAAVAFNAFSASKVRAEAALRESEERFRRVFEEGPLGVALVGKDYRFLKVNSALCRMVGYSEAELTQMSFRDITYPEDLDMNGELDGRLFRSEIPNYRLQKRYVKKDGEIIWINLTASVIRDAKGLPRYGIGMIEDITETKRAFEEAVARQKLEGLGVLAGGIAHDFNNLLGSILATSELVLSDLPIGSPAYDGVESITNVAVRAAGIVRQMMAYAGQESAAFEPVDLSLLVKEMLQLLKVSISKRALLTVDLPEDLPAVQANAAQIRQVAMNLITNASEALGDHEGAISVTLTHVGSGMEPLADNTPNRHRNGHLRLVVSDTGCGMTEELQTRIFDPFFTTKFTGRGLGLAAVQGIIRAHGGTVKVVSAPGQGSRFEVLLPCAAQPARTTRDILVTASAGEAGIVDGTVLVVEDEEELRLAVSTMLRKQKLSVIEARDGRAGVDLFRARREEIDVVLLDLTLPGMTGGEVLQELRRMRPDVKVVITTAYSKDSALLAIDGQEPWLFIRKPYRLSEVTDLLRSVCRRKRSGIRTAS